MALLICSQDAQGVNQERHDSRYGAVRRCTGHHRRDCVTKSFMAIRVEQPSPALPSYSLIRMVLVPGGDSGVRRFAS
jgi:hypothetical protein